jgi:hypothetical protein
MRLTAEPERSRRDWKRGYVDRCATAGAWAALYFERWLSMSMSASPRRQAHAATLHVPTNRHEKTSWVLSSRRARVLSNTRRAWRSDARKSRPTLLHHGATRATVAPMPSPYPSARIAVEADAWRAFRQAAIVRGIPVSVYLGKLVEAELGRRSETLVGEVDAEAAPRDQAMAALSVVRASIDELDDIAGRLARSAAELGGSWSDVASSLGLAEDVARRAYDRARPNPR